MKEREMVPEELTWCYWLSLVAADIRWYGRRRRWLALLRSLKATIVDRDNVERCNDCGRRYPTWLAPDVIYEKAHGSQHGQFCMDCFTRQAEAAGIGLIWTANPVIRKADGSDDWMTALRMLCDEIGAFR